MVARHTFKKHSCRQPRHINTHLQAALARNGSEGRWYVHVVARHTLKDGCKCGVYWGRLALPGDGDLVGRVTLSASDYLVSSDVAITHPSVAVSAAGVVWVGYSFWGTKNAPSESLILALRYVYCIATCVHACLRVQLAHCRSSTYILPKRGAASALRACARACGHVQPCALPAAVLALWLPSQLFVPFKHTHPF